MCTYFLLITRCVFEGDRDFHHRLAKLAQSHGLGATSRLHNEGYKTVSLDLLPSDRVSTFDKKQVDINTTIEDVSKNSDSIHDTKDPDKIHPLVNPDDVEKLLHKAKVIESSGGSQKAKISFYDFAGQEIFHASHPTFLSSKAVYILVFNLKSMLECNNKEKKATKEAESDKGRILKHPSS